MNIAKLNLIGRAATAAICMVTAFSAMAWSQKGHDVTAAIAERHLTPEAAEAIDSLLDGRSIVYWANWLDNASHTPEYAYSRTWHYRNVDANETYATARVAPDGDVVSAIQLNMSTLRNPQAPKADKALALKMLVHLVGDLHQPLHMGHASDLGGNTIKVKFFGQEKNLHSVWDGSLLESPTAGATRSGPTSSTASPKCSRNSSSPVPSTTGLPATSNLPPASIRTPPPAPTSAMTP